MKASNVVAPTKAAKVVPDLEEAIEDEDAAEELAEAKGEDEIEKEEEAEVDLSKDKYIKQPKVKKDSAPKKPAGKKVKAAKPLDFDEYESDEEPKPKKARISKGEVKTKGKK